MIFRKITIAIFAVLALASCNKVLESDPDFSLDGRDLKSVQDYEFVLTGTYRAFHSADYYAANAATSNAFVCLPDMLSDNLDETDESLGNEEVFSRWSYAENEPQIENTWLAAYQIISRTNIIFRGIDAFAATDQGAVNRIKAQAYAIRALVHFDLMRYFVNDYDRNSSSPGIPYISTFDYEVKPARGTVKEDYDHITEDLHNSLALMDNMDQDINSGDSRAYLDVDGVNAILARVFLYANELDSAVKYSTFAIDSRPLAPIQDFQNIWTDASNAEVLWSCVFDAGQGSIGANAYFAPNDRSEYGPNPTLLTLYDDANDVRFPSAMSSWCNRI